MVDVIADCFESMTEVLDRKKSYNILKGLVGYSAIATSNLEADGVLTEASNALYSLKHLNKKVSMSTHVRSIDNVLVYIFLKSILTIPTTTDAFKLGLIDKDGNLQRAPVTDAENAAISNLDLLMAKIRLWLKPHLQKLSSMTWIRSAGGTERTQNALSNADMVSKRAFVIRCNDELDKILRHK